MGATLAPAPEQPRRGFSRRPNASEPRIRATVGLRTRGEVRSTRLDVARAMAFPVGLGDGRNFTDDEYRRRRLSGGRRGGATGGGSWRCWARPNERSELRPPVVAVRPEEASSDGDER